MHLAGVTAKQLAAEVGWNPKYLSVVLNGHKEPKGAEQKLNDAFGRLVQKNGTTSTWLWMSCYPRSEIQAAAFIQMNEE